VGASLDAIRPAPGVAGGGDPQTVFTSLYGLSAPQLPGTLDRIAGAVHADELAATAGSRRLFGQAIGERQAQLRAGAAGGTQQAAAAGLGRLQFAFSGSSGILAEARPAEIDPQANQATTPAFARGGSVWIRALGQFADTGSDGKAPGFGASTGGAIAGADLHVTPELTVGAALGYGHTDLSADEGARGKVDTVQFGLYGGYKIGPWFGDAQLGGAYDRYGTNRSLQFSDLSRTADSSANGWDFSASLKLGYELDVAGCQVEPSAGIRYDRIARNAFTENGAGALSLAVPSGTLNAALSTLGVRVVRNFALDDGLLVVPELRLGWGHELADATATVQPHLAGIPAAALTVASANPGRDAALVGAGVSAVLTDWIKVYADYEADVRANSTSHIVSAGLRFTW
jgi:outer membrane autotransporter protein